MNTPNILGPLDSLLEDYASPKARRLIHSILTLAIALVTLWLAVQGDWEQFVIALAGTVYAAANRANTAPPEPVEDVTEYTGEVSGNADPGPRENEDEPLVGEDGASL